MHSRGAVGCSGHTPMRLRQRWLRGMRSSQARASRPPLSAHPLSAPPHLALPVALASQASTQLHSSMCRFAQSQLHGGAGAKRAVETAGAALSSCSPALPAAISQQAWCWLALCTAPPRPTPPT